LYRRWLHGLHRQTIYVWRAGDENSRTHLSCSAVELAIARRRRGLSGAGFKKGEPSVESLNADGIAKGGIVQDRAKFLEDVSSQMVEMRRLGRRFLEHLTQSETSPQTPANVEVDSAGKIIVKCFDHTVTAQPRFVLNDTDEVYIEYNFGVIYNDMPIYVWRFYLQHGGVLRSKPSAEGPYEICDFENAKVRELIVAEIAIRVLKSPVFAPAKKRELFSISGSRKTAYNWFLCSDAIAVAMHSLM
jgi:hypothetical protein